MSKKISKEYDIDQVAAFLATGIVARFLIGKKRPKNLLLDIASEKQYSNLLNFTGSICYADSLFEALASLDSLQNKQIPLTCERYIGTKMLVDFLNSLHNEISEKNPEILNCFPFYKQFHDDCDAYNIIYQSSAMAEFIGQYFDPTNRGHNVGPADSNEVFRYLSNTIYPCAFDSFFYQKKINIRCELMDMIDPNPTTTTLNQIEINLFENDTGSDVNLTFLKIVKSYDDGRFSYIETEGNQKFCGNKTNHFHLFHEIYIFSDVICFEVKRHSRQVGKRVQFTWKTFELPENFTFFTSQTTYKLKCCICHNGGHYNTYALRGGNWFKFDDLNYSHAIQMKDFHEMMDTAKNFCVLCFYEKV